MKTPYLYNVSVCPWECDFPSVSQFTYLSMVGNNSRTYLLRFLWVLGELVHMKHWYCAWHMGRAQKRTTIIVNSLAVQWLGLPASTAGGTRFDPRSELRSYILQGESKLIKDSCCYY